VNARCLVALVAGLVPAAGLAGAKHAPHWDYSGAEGPAHWAGLAPEFGSCSGKEQSPIDIRHPIEAQLEPLHLAYRAGGTALVNNGHTAQVDYVPGSSLTLDGIRFELNRAGETSLIEGRLVADNYSVSFMLRQSFSPRRARLLYNFQNYSTSLGFFPDTFVPHMSNDNSWLHKQEAKQSRRETIRKVLDKAFNRDSDLSHAYAFAAALEKPGGNGLFSPCLRVESLKSFYDVLFDVGRMVYEQAPVQS